MTTSRATERLRGLGALVALLVLVVGVPAFLAVAIGWPLPRGLPSTSAVGDALNGRTSIDDTVWLRALACIAWLAWVRVAVAVVLEVVAVRRGTSHPTSGLGRAVATLVTTAILVLSSTSRPSTALPLPNLRPAAAAARQVASPPSTVVDTTTVASDATWTVQRDDTLWDIAERTLGDPLRWSEIFDLNEGRPQPDGRSLTDPGRITPGWLLKLPADANRQPAMGSTVTVAPGDTLSGIAAETLGDSNRYPELFAASAETLQPDGAHLKDPNLIRPGWQITIPGPAPMSPVEDPQPVDPPSAAPAPEAAPLAPAPGQVSSPQSPAPSVTSASDESDPSHETLPLRSGILAATVLASGVVTVLARRRLRIRRNRPFGRREPVRSGTIVEDEERTRRAAASMPPAVAGSLAAIVEALTPDQRIDAVTIAPDGAVELLFSTSVDVPPAGWQADPTGRVLTAPHVLDIRDRSTELRWLLCCIGVTGEREVLIDLREPALTFVDGEADESIALFRSMLLSVATSPLIDMQDVIYVGRSRGPNLEAVRTMTPREALDELPRLRKANERAAGAIAGSVVFVDARFVDAGDATQIAELAGPGLAVVLTGDPLVEAPRGLSAASGRVTVSPNELTIDAVATPAECADLWRLAELDDEPTCEAMEADPPLSEVGASEVVAHVLGPVRFDGDSNRFSRRIAEEVVIYLALHRAGVTEERLMTALWPDRAPARSSFNQAVSRARVGLGVSADGAHRLPLVSDALYRVTDVVMTDVELLDHLRRKLASAPMEADVERAVELLGSIDGLPFTSRGPGYEWAHAEGQVAWAQGVVSDAGHLVACIAIERGEPATSIQAARAALRACPADEVLYRDLMRAFDAMGNPAAVEAAFRELCAVIEAEVPEDDVHPETWDVFRQLVPRAVRSVS